MKEKQVFHNAKWIIVCKIIQSVMQLIIGMISARYLGPSNYGLLNYAASIIAFTIPFMKLGFDAILVYELVQHPEEEGEIIGTSQMLNIVSSLIGISAATLFVSIVNYGEKETILVCFLYSISLFFGALEMIQYWFQYKLMSKYSSIVMLVAYVVVSLYKIFLLVSEKSIYWFALSHAVEYAVISIFLFIIYFKKDGGAFRFSFARAKSMLSRSKHYILASLIVVIIQNIDHIMLTGIYGNEENGYYSAAITCVTVFQFVFVAIADSFRPLILDSKKRQNGLYEKNISRLYSISLYMAIMQTVVFVIFAKTVVLILYGKDYFAAINVFRILSLYFIFSLMGLLRNIWILAEEKQKYLWMINLGGALMNIILNSFMIPLWGACGAAFASLLTQFFMNFIFGFIFKSLRQNNKLMLQGLNPRFFVREVRYICKELLKKE